MPDDTSHDGSCREPHTEAEARPVVGQAADQRGLHIDGHCRGRAGVIRAGACHTGYRKVPVAECLNLLETISSGERVQLVEDAAQQMDQAVRCNGVCEGGKANNIGKENCCIVVPVSDLCFATLQSRNDHTREYLEKKRFSPNVRHVAGSDEVDEHRHRGHGRSHDSEHEEHQAHLWGPINPSGGVPRMLAVQPAEQRAEKSAQGGPGERKHGAGLASDLLWGPTAPGV